MKSSERLTNELQTGSYATLKDEPEKIPGSFGSYDWFMAYITAVTRLKQYEDTGLSPEEIMAGLVPPHNPLLTMDDLRKMRGAKIYSTRHGPIRCYGIVDGSTDCGPEIDIGGDRRVSLEGFGETWWTYWRKPE